MREASVNKFRAHLKDEVERVIEDHEPLCVKRRNGADFVVISAEDWQRERETLYVLQNSPLMKQLSDSFATHEKGLGYKPSQEELDEINSL